MSCGCEIKNEILVKQCKYHMDRDKKLRDLLSLHLETRIRREFKDTYLYDIRDRILAIVKGIRIK